MVKNIYEIYQRPTKERTIAYIQPRKQKRGNRLWRGGLYIYLQCLFNYHFTIANFDIICFCIMPNHYHILALQRDKIGIGEVIQKIGIIYTKHINRKYRYNGHLFQGTYKYKPITNLAMFRIVYSYILHNPEKIKEKNRLILLQYNQFLFNYYFLNFPEVI